MRVATQPQPLSQCSAKAPQVEINNIVDLADLTRYFRREHGMSSRTARFHAREVYRDKTKAKDLLPVGWFEDIYPPAVTFTRRGGGLGAPFTPQQHAAWLKAGGDRA